MNNDSTDSWDCDRLAKFLDVSVDWVRRQVQSNYFPHMKAGRLVRFGPQEIERIMEKLRVPERTDA